MAKLVCQSGPTAGHEYPLNKELISLGRQGTCDVQIMDTMSSRVHCQVRKDGKLYTLVDLGSRNGTQLNGKKVTERQLAYGDRIKVGEVEYLLVKEPGDVELRDLLSKYEIQEKLGEGGMGIVYKATQRSMARIVALKVLSPKYAAKPRFVEQFIREARAAGQLNHPNIIQVHDVGTENGIHYFSMEFVDGPTCMQVLRQNGSFPTPEALEICRQTAKALEYAHGQRLIHQDIKPDNIMLTASSTVKLADLGISKTFDEVEQEEGGPKRVMGTPHYMAPEAALGKKIDQRVDIYGLGATLYHLLTGKTPYAGTSATEVLKAHVMDPMPAIQDFNPSVPNDVTALVERMMAKKPEDRYQSAGEVADEIKRLQSGLKLGIERIASSETMILQKLARGDGTAAQLTPAQTTGHRTGGRRAHGTTGSRDELEPVATRMRLALVVGLVAVVLLVVGLVVPRLVGTNDHGKPKPTPAPTGGVGVAVDPPTPTPKDPVKDPVKDPPKPGPGQDDDAIRAQADQLKALEDQLKAGGADLDHKRLLGKLDELVAAGLAPVNQPRAASLRTQIDRFLQKRQAEARDQALADLTSEVRKLASDDERNYDLALSRIAAFPYAKDAEAAPKLAALRDDCSRRRDDYLNELKQRVQQLTQQKNAARLREMRDKLPKSMLGSPIEQDIVKALKGLDDEIAKQQQTVLGEAAKDLAKWAFSDLERLHLAHRDEMGDTPGGRKLDEYLAASQKLVEMGKAIGVVLTDKPARYRGSLQKWDNPELTGADGNGLLVRLAIDGGSATLLWSKLDPSEIDAIANMVLQDKIAAFKPALDLLAASHAGK